MKQLKFEHVYAEDIRLGKRRTTLRIDDKNLRIGDIVQLVDKVSSNKPQEWKITGSLSVIGIQEFRLGTIPLELVEQAEIGSSDKRKLLEFLRRFYGDNVSDETIIKLVTFDFTPFKTPLDFLIQDDDSHNTFPEEVILYADGGSRGNPGPSAAGFVIQTLQGDTIKSWNKYLGLTTNNQAEYHGLIAGLEWCKSHGIKELHVRLDSLLVVNQMKGIFKVKNRDLWTLYESAKKLQASFKSISYTHVPRELNKKADEEVNKALDAIKGSDVIQ